MAATPFNAPRGRRTRPKPVPLGEDSVVSPTRMSITFDATEVPPLDRDRSASTVTPLAVTTPSRLGISTPLRRASSAGRIGGRLTPLPSRVPKGSSSLACKDDESLCVLGTTADALAFLNAGCRIPKTPAKVRPPGYLPQLGPSLGLEPPGPGPPDPVDAAAVSTGAPAPAPLTGPGTGQRRQLSTGRVEFCPTPMNTVHVITPYSKVYGKHPSLFHYDRKGEMQLNDKGVAALMEEGGVGGGDLDVD